MLYGDRHLPHVLVKFYLVYGKNATCLYRATPLKTPYILAWLPFSALANLRRYCSLKPIRPTVPYTTVAMPKNAHTPVMMAPIGNMRIWVPGRTKGTAATIDAACAAVAIVLGWSEKAPVTNVASFEESVVLTVEPLPL